MVVERRFSYEKGTKASDWEALREGSPSAPDCMKKYGVGYTCVCNWRREYEESAGLERPRKGKPIQVPEGAPAPSEYEAMGKDEPIAEPMRRDMEVARLKKATR